MSRAGPVHRRSTALALRAGAAGLATLVLALTVGCGRRRTPISEPLFSLAAGTTGHAARASAILSRMWPADFRAVQRVIITVGRRQYVADGVMTAAPTTGLRLAVVSPLGLVTEVASPRPGQGEVMRTTPLFPEDWARRYVVRDLERLFRAPADASPAGRLVEGRIVLESGSTLERVRYIVNPQTERLEDIEVVENGCRVYRAHFSGWQLLTPWPSPLPTVIEVDADSYQLWIRLVRISLASPPDPVIE